MAARYRSQMAGTGEASMRPSKTVGVGEAMDLNIRLTWVQILRLHLDEPSEVSLPVAYSLHEAMRAMISQVFTREGMT